MPHRTKLLMPSIMKKYTALEPLIIFGMVKFEATVVQ